MDWIGFREPVSAWTHLLGLILAVLVVGNTADFDKPLGSLGAVTTVDISIPAPPGDGMKSEK